MVATTPLLLCNDQALASKPLHTVQRPWTAVISRPVSSQSHAFRKLQAAHVRDLQARPRFARDYCLSSHAWVTGGDGEAMSCQHTLREQCGMHMIECGCRACCLGSNGNGLPCLQGGSGCAWESTLDDNKEPRLSSHHRSCILPTEQAGGRRCVEYVSG
jgi:hypothetical protein